MLLRLLWSVTAFAICTNLNLAFFWTPKLVFVMGAVDGVHWEQIVAKETVQTDGQKKVGKGGRLEQRRLRNFEPGKATLRLLVELSARKRPC